MAETANPLRLTNLIPAETSPPPPPSPTPEEVVAVARQGLIDAIDSQVSRADLDVARNLLVRAEAALTTAQAARVEASLLLAQTTTAQGDVTALSERFQREALLTLHTVADRLDGAQRRMTLRILGLVFLDITIALIPTILLPAEIAGKFLVGVYALSCVIVAVLYWRNNRRGALLMGKQTMTGERRSLEGTADSATGDGPSGGSGP